MWWGPGAGIQKTRKRKGEDEELSNRPKPERSHRQIIVIPLEVINRHLEIMLHEHEPRTTAYLVVFRQ